MRECGAQAAMATQAALVAKARARNTRALNAPNEQTLSGEMRRIILWHADRARTIVTRRPSECLHARVHIRTHSKLDIFIICMLYTITYLCTQTKILGSSFVDI